MSRPAISRTGQRLAGLDVLRGLAITLVILRHTWPSAFPGSGVVGVVAFFTLSGYLITGLLLSELTATGRIDYQRFYRRRARRLVPALVAMLAVFSVVTLTVDPMHDRSTLPRTLLFALTWTGDLPFGHASPATFHLWTLAVEEQFYLVWPVLLAFLFRRRRLLSGAIAVAVLALLAGWLTVARFHADPDLTYDLPTTWACCFVLGALARIAPIKPGVLGGRAAVGLALGGLAVLSLLPLRGHAVTYLVGGPVISGLTAVLLIAWSTWRRSERSSLRGLIWLGQVSYAAYLWNYPLTLWLRPVDPTGLIAITLTLAAAYLSWRCIESPVAAQRPRRAVSSADVTPYVSRIRTSPPRRSKTP